MNLTRLACDCGQVQLAVRGRPIISAECLCTDCQQAGALLRSLPGARPVLDRNGATRFELLRKDRVRCAQGAQHLRAHRLTRGSRTRRVVAGCCHTPMFLEFTSGHWLSIYGARWPAASRPALQVRTMTRSRPAGARLDDDVPNPRTHSFSFYAKLFAAWAAMRFRVPPVDFVDGELDLR